MKILKNTETNAAVKRRYEIRKQRLGRAVCQLIFFFSMPSAFMAGFAGVKELFSQIHTGLPLELSHFLFVLIVLCSFTILFGRFFCGYACAFGTFGDLIYGISCWIQKKIFRKKHPYTLSEHLVCLLQKGKYGILFSIVLFCYLGIYEVISEKNPWNVFSMLTVGKMPFHQDRIAIILFLVIIIGMALQERFFCQFLCPMGAIFSLLPILPFLNIQRKEDDCPENCRLCKQQCPVHLQLEQDAFRSGECISCGACQARCPKKNIQILQGKLSGKEGCFLFGKVVLLFVLGSFLGLCRFPLPK